MEFLQYFIVMYIFMLSPGPSMALISRNSAKHGISKASFTILGIVTSVTFYSILSVVGVGALIKLYPNAFKIFKTIGSCYIIYLGVKIFLSSFKTVEKKVSEEKESTHWKDYVTGLTTDLANPLSFVGITSIILGFVHLSTPINEKLFFLILTILATFGYTYTYAIIFGNPIARKFIKPRMSIFEKIAGIAVAVIGVIFLVNTIKL